MPVSAPVAIEVRCPYCRTVVATVAVVSPGDRYHCANRRCGAWFGGIANPPKQVY